MNAISSRSRGSRRSRDLEPRDVEIQGLVFREVLSVTQIAGGIATNVIPARGDCDAQLPLRAGPHRRDEAEARLRELVDGAGELEIARQLAAGPRRGGVAARAARCATSGDFEVEPKQAWTPVAEFSAQGLDAVNLGPGRDALRAHAGRAGRDRRAPADATRP